MAIATVTYTWYYTSAATATTGGTKIGSAQTTTIDITDGSGTKTGAVSHTVPALAAAIGGGIYVTANVSGVSDNGYSNDDTAVTKSIGSAVTARPLNAGSASLSPTSSQRGKTYTATVTLPSWSGGSTTNTIMGGTDKGSTVSKTTTATYQWYYCNAITTNDSEPIVTDTAPAGYSAISGQTSSTFSTPSYGKGGSGFGVKVTFAAVNDAFTYTKTDKYYSFKQIPKNTAKLTNIAFSGTPQVGDDVTATFTITMS